MVTPQQLIQIQMEFEPDQEELYQEFKVRIDKAIEKLPEYVKTHRDAEYYPESNPSKFKENCRNFCVRYVMETETQLQIYPGPFSCFIRIRWRGAEA